MEYSKPEVYNIIQFEKGDIITRVNPSIVKTTMGDANDVQYIGQKYIFLGIANGSIYLERTSTMEKLFNGQTFFIPFCNYEIGWGYYEEPAFLEGKGNIISMMEKSMEGPKNSALKKLYKKAIEDENYAFAAKIQKEIKKMKENDNQGELDLGNPDTLFGILGDMIDDDPEFNDNPDGYNPEDED